VDSGVKLTIEAGTTVRFQQGKSFTINGTLVARGSADKLIAFTSHTGSGPGDWNNINFSSTSTPATFDANNNYVDGSIIQYATIEYGGGSYGMLYLQSSPFIDHTTVRESSRYGIYIAPSASTSIYSARITNNAITNNVGGLYLKYHSSSVNIVFNLSGNNISNNTVNEYGGGVSITTSSSSTGNKITLSNNTINSNVGGSQGGGAYLNVPKGSLVVTDNTFLGNASNYYSSYGGSGGGVYVSAGDAFIDKNTITSNNTSEGGGLTIASSGTVTVTNNAITNNAASDFGGGIAIKNSLNVFLSKNSISGNSVSSTATSTTEKGGGAILLNQSGASISDNIITDNSTSYNGGGIFLVKNSPVIKNNTISRNKAANGGGIYLSDGCLSTINNNNLHSNTANTGDDLYNMNSNTQPAVNAKSNWWNTTDSSVIESHIHHQTDNPLRGLVDFSSSLTSAVGEPITPPTPTNTAGPSPTATRTPSPTPSDIPSSTPSPVPPSATPSSTLTPFPSAIPSSTSTPFPSAMPSSTSTSPSKTPTKGPFATNTATPVSPPVPTALVSTPTSIPECALQIPANAITVETTVEEGNASIWWVKGNGKLITTKGGNTIFVESGGAVELKGGAGNAVYLKQSSSLVSYLGGYTIAYYAPGATIEPNEQLTLIPCGVMSFIYPPTITPTKSPTVGSSPTASRNATASPTPSVSLTPTGTPKASATPFTSASPLLTIDNKTGKPGSYFTLTGSTFPVNTTVKITVNGYWLISLAVPSNNFQVILNTIGSKPGDYTIVAEVNPATQATNPSTSISFSLDLNATLRTKDPSATGPELQMPDALKDLTQRVYLPLIRR
jgi:parallel beta-helix repeat protein